MIDSQKTTECTEQAKLLQNFIPWLLSLPGKNLVIASWLHLRDSARPFKRQCNARLPGASMPAVPMIW